MKVRRAFPANSGILCENRHRCEVRLVILYTGTPSFSRIRARLLFPNLSLSLPVRSTMASYLLRLRPPDANPASTQWHLLRISQPCARGPLFPEQQQQTLLLSQVAAVGHAREPCGP